MWQDTKFCCTRSLNFNETFMKATHNNYPFTLLVFVKPHTYTHTPKVCGFLSSLLHIIQIDPRQLIISNPNVVKTHRTPVFMCIL